jgi:cytochrome c553
MDSKCILLVAASIGMVVGCANLQRSRDTANPEVSGDTLAMQVCSNCHGRTGNAISPNFPNLSGQPEAYVAGQLHEFKKHSRQDPAGYEYMWGLSHNLSDKQIDELARHFSGLMPERQPVEGQPAQIAAGETIFNNGVPAKGIPACNTCHGPKGEGNATFPRIAGQHRDYLIKQLTVFQRTNQRPEGIIMKTVAHELTKDNIDNVAAYLQARPNR